MLRHEQNSEDKAVPAEQVRVTPEELTAALARLEARQEASQQHLRRTVEIGEVVKELGLNVSAEEVLAEVRQHNVKPKRKRDYVALACATACLIPLLLGAVNYRLLLVLVSVSHRMFYKSPDAGLTQAQITERYFRMRIDPNSVVQISTKEGSMTSTVQEVHDGLLFQCDLHGANHFYNDGASPGTPWTFLKRHGKVYVCGWTQPISTVAPPDGDVIVYRQSKDIRNGGQVSLPLDEFIHANDNETQDNPEKISAFVQSPDKHLWEKWQP